MKAKDYFDKQELFWLGKQIEYNNNWTGQEIWKRQHLQGELDKVLANNNINQVIVPIHLEDNAFDVLKGNADIAKLFSVFLDIYDELPYRPDVAFDLIWRAFESLTNYYYKNINPKPANTTEAIKDIAGKISVVVSRDAGLLASMEELLSKTSPAFLRFCFNFFVDKNPEMQSYDLWFDKAKNKIGKRFEDAVGSSLFDNFKTQYLTADFIDNIVNHADHDVRENVNEAVGVLKSLLTGNDVTVNGVHYNSLCFEKRLELLISGVLYSIRNNRFHGDNYSLFKSSRSNLNTYNSFYHCLISTYALFWIVLYDYLDREGINKFFSTESISQFINESLARMGNVHK